MHVAVLIQQAVNGEMWVVILFVDVWPGAVIAGIRGEIFADVASHGAWHLSHWTEYIDK